MKTILLPLPLILLAGCVSPANFATFAKSLAGDSATVTLQVNTIYGTMKFVRTNPGTNCATVAPDGTVTVNK